MREGREPHMKDKEGKVEFVHTFNNWCDADGPPEKRRHVFNIPWESDDGLAGGFLSGGFLCRCGKTNLSFSLENDE